MGDEQRSLLHMVMAGLGAKGSFAASWQTIWKQLVGAIPGAGGESPGSGTVSKARQRISPKAWGHLFDWLSKRMQEQAGASDGGVDSGPVPSLQPQAPRAGQEKRLSAPAALGPGPRLARAEAESDGGCEGKAVLVLCEEK